MTLPSATFSSDRLKDDATSGVSEDRPLDKLSTFDETRISQLQHYLPEALAEYQG